MPLRDVSLHDDVSDVSLNDPAFVRAQYESEANLAARKSVYTTAEGPDPRELAFEAVAEMRPGQVLEVGGGEGELAERIVRELGAELVGIDQSQRMVEIQISKGIDARVGDAQDLPFRDAEFDVAVAAWMLYHVPDLHRTLAELARVLRRGGRLVAVTNGLDHLRELRELAGQTRTFPEGVFVRENGEELLRRHFAHVERRDADGWVTMDDEALRRYVATWEEWHPILDLPPFEQPLRIRRLPTIFIAETATTTSPTTNAK
jgi:SAM-dependent methyltransferase